MRRLFALATVVLFGAQSQATVLIEQSFDDLVRKADGVILGTVADITPRLDERGDIYTYITFGELEVVHGLYDGATLTLRFEGGLIDGQGLEVVGSPTFQPAERVILFVRDNGQSAVPLVGWEQGVFRVLTDPATGEEVISDSLGNPVLAIRDGEIIREQLVESEAEILDLGPDAAGRSAPPGGDSGVTDGDEAAEWMEQQAADALADREVTAEAMSLGQFVEKVEEIAGMMSRAAAEPLVSVEPGPEAAARSGIGALQPGEESGRAEEPGELPQPSESEGEGNPGDLQ